MAQPLKKVPLSCSGSRNLDGRLRRMPMERTHLLRCGARSSHNCSFTSEQREERVHSSLDSAPRNAQPLVSPVVFVQTVTSRLMAWCSATAGALKAQKENLRWRDHSGLCALSMLALPVALPTEGWVGELLNNRTFWGAFWAWLTAQTLKIFTKKYKTGVWDLRAIFDSGGMPSSHSALCAGLTTSIALEYGLGSPLFAIALTFTSIVMYDACGVRRHAGRTAEALNQVINELMEKEHPVTAMKLKEVLGHTPRQVLAGAMLGVFLAMYLPLPSHPI